MAELVTPHGGKLIDRIVPDAAAAARLQTEAASAPSLTLDARELADVELIATGAASPLTGFLGKADYTSVLERMRLADGTVWTLPFTLAVTEAQAKTLAVGKPAALRDANGRLWGVIDVAEIYTRDPLHESRSVYKTDDQTHPGVAYLVGRPTTLVGGSIRVLPLPEDLPFAKFRFTPTQLRAKIAALGWKKIAGFQTRNPIHRAHEYLTKIALEYTDGLVLHPLVGETKNDDVPASVRFQSYELLVEKFYPKDRTILAAFPAAMRYAGPREAIFHAVVRKNYGITNIIVGRDHAGVGKFYGPLEAQQMFEKFPVEDVGVTPLKFEPTFFCKACDALASLRTCAHDASQRVEFSGTKVREILRTGGFLPKEFTRPEIGEVLRAHYLKESGGTAPPPIPIAQSRPQQGFILWFTGLSGAGKSTLANALRKELGDLRPVEILDGDEVRTYLSKGLGFSKEDRDTNIRRIGFVARILARNGTPVITAAISPYKDVRNEVRQLATQEGIPFIEVFAKASIEALTARDVKGLYKKALAGEVKNFTGISDPYEAPDNPEIVACTDRDSVETSMRQILDLLRSRGLIPAAVQKAA
jgi:sulfate adenylyltransferase